jgi:hypothetical protein
MKFSQWLINESAQDDVVKEVADKWFRTDGSAKTRAMTQTMIGDTMRSYNLGLIEAAKLFEKALLLYSNEHGVGGAEAYWSLVRRMTNG